MKNKYAPALICGFGAAVLATIPVIKTIACCMVLPLAAMISVYLYNKVNQTDQKFPIGTGLLFGFLTGIFAAVFSSTFDLIITYLTHSNEFVLSFPQSEAMIKEWDLGPIVDESMKMMKQMKEDIIDSGFSIFYTIMILISNLLTYSIFGFIGGAIAVSIINKQKKNNSATD